MEISEMTHMSYFFIIMAVLFGIITITMYFVLDIKRCWKIIWGRHSAASNEKVPGAVTLNTEHRKSNEISAKTERLVPDKMETLSAFEETVPLEIMTLVQDIVMMDGKCNSSAEG